MKAEALDSERTTVRHTGRPRDQASAPAIRAAARKLVRSKGYDQVSIADIIREAGVSRQTLYRRWPGKADLVLEAFYESAGSVPGIAEHGDARATLEQFLCDIFDHLSRDGDAIRSLIAAAQENPGFGQRFRSQFVEPREAMMTRLLERARETGELPADADIELLTTVLHGAFWYRLLNMNELTTDWAARLCALVFVAATTS